MHSSSAANYSPMQRVYMTTEPGRNADAQCVVALSDEYESGQQVQYNTMLQAREAKRLKREAETWHC